MAASTSPRRCSGWLSSSARGRCLTLFALLLTRVEASYAGRAYAAYGGIYVAASLFWLAFVERSRPLWSDWLGVALCVVGASVVLFGPRLSQ